MADKLMYVRRTSPMMLHKIYLFCRLQLVVETFEYQLNEPTNNLIVIKIVKATNKKTLLENFGD